MNTVNLEGFNSGQFSLVWKLTATSVLSVAFSGHQSPVLPQCSALPSPLSLSHLLHITVVLCLPRLDHQRQWQVDLCQGLDWLSGSFQLSESLRLWLREGFVAGRCHPELGVVTRQEEGPVRRPSAPLSGLWELVPGLLGTLVGRSVGEEVAA